jgi:hypothetical protein
MPDVWSEKCKADVSLVVDIAVKKYCDSLPLNRIQEEYRRENVFISRQTMWGWIRMMSEIIAVIYERMVEKVIHSGHIFIDEIPVLLKTGEEKCRRAYVLVCAGGGGGDPPYRIYAFCENRRHATIQKFIEHFTGFYHSDQYGAYASIAGREGLFWIPCMVHVRRKFLDADAGDPQFRAWVLRMIRNLFRYERVAWKRSSEERMRIRRELEEPIIDELIAGVIRYRQQGPYLLPQSKLANAIDYFLKASPHLKNYLKSPDARIDNNVAERSCRPIAVGRKNWLYFASERGGKAGCMLISIIQTCRALGVNPREYLTDILLRMNTHPYRQIDHLLPDRWAELRKKEAAENAA